MQVRIDRLQRLAAEVAKPSTLFDVSDWNHCLCGITSRIPEFVADGVKPAGLKLPAEWRGTLSGGMRYRRYVGLAAFVAFYGVEPVDAAMLCMPILYVDSHAKEIALHLIRRVIRLETEKQNAQQSQLEAVARSARARAERAAVAFVRTVRARAAALVALRVPAAPRHELAASAIAPPEMATLG
jgi:hypothetical protein